MVGSGHELNTYQPLFYVDQKLDVRSARKRFELIAGKEVVNVLSAGRSLRTRTRHLLYAHGYLVAPQLERERFTGREQSLRERLRDLEPAVQRSLSRYGNRQVQHWSLTDSVLG